MGMPRKKKTEARWRLPPCTPEQLPARYKEFLDKLVLVATGETFVWNSMTRNFYQTLAQQLHCLNWRAKVDTLRDTLKEARSFDADDIRQEALMILLDHFKSYMAKRQKVKFTLYTLLNVPRRLAEKIASLILVERGDRHQPVYSEEYWMDEPESLNLNLGWVSLKSQEGVFSRLSLFQKYLLFLRYKESMTVQQISQLLGRPLSHLESDFGKINAILSEYKE